MTATAQRIAHETSIPTQRESAQRILSLFAQWNKVPGSVLAKRRFMMLFHSGRFQDSDRVLGLAYAIRQQWLEDNGRYVKLLAAGFKEMVRLELSQQDSSDHLASSHAGSDRQVPDRKVSDRQHSDHQASDYQVPNFLDADRLD